MVSRLEMVRIEMVRTRIDAPWTYTLRMGLYLYAV